LAHDRAREDWIGKTQDIHENDFEHLKKAEQVYVEIANTLPGFRLIKCTHNGQILSRESIHFLVWLAANQLVAHQAKAKPGFESISSLIGASEQILKNRDLLFNNNNGNNNNQNSQANKITETPKPISDFPNFIPQAPELPENKELSLPKPDKLMRVTIERVSPEAKMPQLAHAGDAGFDLYAADYYSITAYGQALVSTGIKMAIPSGHVGLVWDKSGLANDGITTMGGVIDSNYRGEIKVIIKNLSEDIFNIVPGQKIAQILIQEIKTPILEDGLIADDTNRQAGGFGSSGKF
jgi:dUTP pyrophosphatase